MQIANCQLPIVNCQLPIPNFKLPIANCQLQITNCQLPIANCKLSITNCKLQIANCKLQITNFIVRFYINWVSYLSNSQRICQQKNALKILYKIMCWGRYFKEYYQVSTNVWIFLKNNKDCWEISILL